MEDRIQEFRRRVSATRPPNLGYHHPKDDHILDESEGKKLPIVKKKDRFFLCEKLCVFSYYISYFNNLCQKISNDIPLIGCPQHTCVLCFTFFKNSFLKYCFNHRALT